MADVLERILDAHRRAAAADHRPLDALVAEAATRLSEQVTATTGALAGVTVTAEIVRPEKGPKIKILKFKNKTGYRKRQGHRSQLTRIKVTGIEK